MNGWVIFLIIIAILLVGGMIYIGLKVGMKLLHPPRKPLHQRPDDFGIRSYEEIMFPSKDGLRISGWYMEAKKEQGVVSSTIIFAHGYSQNRLEPHVPALALASDILRAGYDVLMFDFRNAGLSEGTISTIGLYEQRDLMGAVDYAKKLKPDHSIGLIGFSMGAATSLMVAGADPRVDAVVADSPFSSLPDYLRDNLPRWTRLPSFPFNWLILTLMPWFVREDPKKVKPIEALKRYGCKPVLLIHGTCDNTIPCVESEKLLEAAEHPEAELWKLEDADHVRCYSRDPEEYKKRVLKFFQKYLSNLNKKS
ncbi:alpha/beta hydrolase [Brevibacillus daliensis]|uniref:alpha/beta hydrolase n=1 Tax=Brevibacillus daliensis TaxID=2892995 RepID=UPI001E556C71|nr:alpha/beta hydrolase [Brevibacillus daliensis]